jgi:hypothetical protein
MVKCARIRRAEVGHCSASRIASAALAGGTSRDGSAPKRRGAQQASPRCECTRLRLFISSRGPTAVGIHRIRDSCGASRPACQAVAVLGIGSTPICRNNETLSAYVLVRIAFPSLISTITHDPQLTFLLVGAIPAKLP